MNLIDLITPETVFIDVAAGSKKQVLEELAKRAAATTGVKPRIIFDLLVERERLGPTGIGKGVAIPHGKSAELQKICGLFARLEKPVAFDATDEQPVDLLFVILAPEKADAEHLKILAQTSRLMRDDKMCTQIRHADRAESLYALLTNTTTRTAA